MMIPVVVVVAATVLIIAWHNSHPSIPASRAYSDSTLVVVVAWYLWLHWSRSNKKTLLCNCLVVAAKTTACCWHPDSQSPTEPATPPAQHAAES